MKKCVICIVLLCFVMSACATVSQPPASTTVLQSNSTSQMPLCYQGDNVWEHKYEGVYCVYCGISRPRPTIDWSTSCPPTTVPPTSCTPTTVPITKPTTKPTTKPSTSPVVNSTTMLTSKPTNSTTLPKLQLVRVWVGDQCIVPISVQTRGKMYWDERNTWATLGCAPIMFDQYDDSQIPSVTLTAPVKLELADNVDKAVGLWVQTDKKAHTGTSKTLDGLSELEPGVYYVRLSILQWGRYVAGDYETKNYDLGFKLIVPGT